MLSLGSGDGVLLVSLAEFERRGLCEDVVSTEREREPYEVRSLLGVEFETLSFEWWEASLRVGENIVLFFFLFFFLNKNN